MTKIINRVVQTALEVAATAEAEKREARMMPSEAVVMDNWKQHGGYVHGPHVETVTMPLESFHRFMRSMLKQAFSAAIADSLDRRNG